MKSINLVLRDFDGELLGEDTIGVDRGAWVCMTQDIPMICACGDFDSVSKEDLAKIKTRTRVDQLPQEKDMTDFEYALTLTQDYDTVYVYGALGGRLDHLLVNVELLKRDARIRFISQDQSAYVLHKGTYTFDANHRYISFLALTDSIITLEGVKYPLHNQFIKPRDLYLTSNEIVDKKNQVILHEGCVLYIGIFNETR